MKRRNIKRTTLTLTIAILCLLILGGGSKVFDQTSSGQRWHPNRSPANVEFEGDQVCAECHKSKVITQSQSAMGMAMEPVANSKVLAENPVMTFSSGPYTYEIKRKDKQSTYTVTDGKETISLPILYAFGQGKAGQTYVLQYEGAYYESLVSFYYELRGLDFTIGAPRTVPESLTSQAGKSTSRR